MRLRWEGTAENEVGIVESVDTAFAENSSLQPGKEVVRVDPRYFRPTEVETLLGDPTKARTRLQWQPQTTFAELVAEMVRSDYAEAKRDHLCRSEGFVTPDHHE